MYSIVIIGLLSVVGAVDVTGENVAATVTLEISTMSTSPDVDVQATVDRVCERFQKVFDTVIDPDECAQAAMAIVEEERLTLGALSGVQLGQLLAHSFMMDVAGLRNPAREYLSNFLDDSGANGATATVHLYGSRIRQMETLTEKVRLYRETFNHAGLEEALAAGALEHLFFNVGVRDEQILREVLPDLLALKRLLRPEFAEHVRYQLLAYFEALRNAAETGHDVDLQWYRQRMYELAVPQLEKVENEGHRRMLEDIIATLGGAAARGELIDHPAPPTAFLWSSVPKWSSLDDLKGKVVVLEFWATWCGPCRAAFPSTRQLQEHYADAPVVIIGATEAYGWTYTADRQPINHEGNREQEYAAMPQFMQEMEMTWPVVFVEKSVAGDYDAGLPGIVLIDAHGIVRHAGLHPAQPKEEIISKIDALLREAAMTVPGE